MQKRKKAGKHTKKKQKVTKDILIGDLVKKYPHAVEVLAKHGFHCIGCTLSPYETLEAGAAVHGIPTEPLLKEINKALSK